MSDSQTSSGWVAKFANALRGLRIGIRGQNSFLIHIPVAVAVCALAWILRLDSIRISLLLLCIAIVLSAELFNSSIESIAKAITCESDPQIRDALDIASGAVLVLAIIATVIGLTMLLPELVS